jgi:hypothetical protein
MKGALFQPQEEPGEIRGGREGPEKAEEVGHDERRPPVKEVIKKAHPGRDRFEGGGCVPGRVLRQRRKGLRPLGRTELGQEEQALFLEPAQGKFRGLDVNDGFRENLG